MVSAKRLAQMAKNWQRMAAMGRKRLTRTTTAAAKGSIIENECSTALSPSVAMKGHCVVYTADNSARFEVPLAYPSTAFFSELLTMSQEAFGFAGGNDGRIMLPCDATVLEYAMCLLRRDASVEVMRVFMSSVARPCSSFEGGAVAPCVGLGHEVAEWYWYGGKFKQGKASQKKKK
uniref:Uncharacterized protein n=1 Tax=Aegilops tauschii subsp. strangulata TaxID=200361 RepID=A0A453LJ33_AEGTS